MSQIRKTLLLNKIMIIYIPKIKKRMKHQVLEYGQILFNYHRVTHLDT